MIVARFSPRNPMVLRLENIRLQNYFECTGYYYITKKMCFVTLLNTMKIQYVIHFTFPFSLLCDIAIFDNSFSLIRLL